jgi:adenylate cyclase
MTDSSLITQINDWLNDQALGQPNIIELFEGVCQRLSRDRHSDRARQSDVVDAAPALSRRERPLAARLAGRAGRFIHQDSRTEAWTRSPMSHMLEAQVGVLRRHLTGRDKLIDFDILQDLREEGYTDYLIIATDLFAPPSTWTKTARHVRHLGNGPAGRLHG